MADRKSIENFVRQAYDQRQKNDAEVVSSLLAPNATLHFSGSEKASPVATRVSGQAEIRALLNQLVGQFELIEYEILDLIIEGDRAAVRWTGKFRFRPTMEVFETDLCDLWTIEGDKVCAFVEFCDTAQVVKLVQSATTGQG